MLERGVVAEASIVAKAADTKVNQLRSPEGVVFLVRQNALAPNVEYVVASMMEVFGGFPHERNQVVPHEK